MIRGVDVCLDVLEDVLLLARGEEKGVANRFDEEGDWSARVVCSKERDLFFEQGCGASSGPPAEPGRRKHGTHLVELPSAPLQLPLRESREVQELRSRSGTLDTGREGQDASPGTVAPQSHAACRLLQGVQIGH